MVHDYNLLPGTSHEGRKPLPKSHVRIAQAQNLFGIFAPNVVDFEWLPLSIDVNEFVFYIYSIYIVNI